MSPLDILLGDLSIAEFVRQFVVEILFGPLEAAFTEIGAILILILNPLSIFT